MLAYSPCFTDLDNSQGIVPMKTKHVHPLAGYAENLLAITLGAALKESRRNRTRIIVHVNEVTVTATPKTSLPTMLKEYGRAICVKWERLGRWQAKCRALKLARGT